MYDIKRLKTLACEHFLRAFVNESDVKDMAAIIEYVYSSSPTSDRRLRDIIVTVAADRILEFYRCAEFEDMAKRNNDFSNDLNKTLGHIQELLRENSTPLMPIVCTKCKNGFSSSKRGAGGSVYCPCCGHLNGE